MAFHSIGHSTGSSIIRGLTGYAEVHSFNRKDDILQIHFLFEFSIVRVHFIYSFLLYIVRRLLLYYFKAVNLRCVCELEVLQVSRILFY